MARQTKRLSARSVATLTKPGGCRRLPLRPAFGVVRLPPIPVVGAGLLPLAVRESRASASPSSPPLCARRRSSWRAHVAGVSRPSPPSRSSLRWRALWQALRARSGSWGLPYEPDARPIAVGELGSGFLKSALDSSSVRRNGLTLSGLEIGDGSLADTA